MSARAKRTGLPEARQEHAATFCVTTQMLERGSRQLVGRSGSGARKPGRPTRSSSPPAYDSQTGRRLSAIAIAAAVKDNAGNARSGRQQSTLGQHRRRSNSKMLLHRKWSL